MPRHYYTLAKITDEIKALRSCKVVECFTQEKNSLILAMANDAQEVFIRINCHTQSDSIFLINTFDRAKKNSIDLFQEIIGSKLIDAKILPYDRIIELSFEKIKLYIIMFGGSKSNVIAVDNRNTVISSFKQEKQLTGNKFSPQDLKLNKLTEFPGETTILQALSKCDFLLGKNYSDELLNRLKIENNRKIASFSENEINDIGIAAKKLRNECLQSEKCYISENEKGESVLSLIPLFIYPKLIKEFSSVSDAVRFITVGSYKAAAFNSIYKNIEKGLLKRKEKLLKTQEHILSDINNKERLEKYKLWGELLISHPNVYSKFGDKISLIDYEGNPCNINLDSKLTIIENAQKYFDKAKTAAAATSAAEKRLPKIEDEIMEIEIAYNKFKMIKSIKELENFRNSVKHLIKEYMSVEERETESQFRTFDLGGGFILYVGKNAASNDELTMKFAKPNDLWFHARGAGGSHAVLKLEKNQRPTKEIIRKAAEIVAYYSQARNAKYTPVAYTFKKYVRKPKGANPGSVVMAREEVIMVEPGIR